MAEMSPVELLRAAAARVRERADNASVGPWRVLADPQEDAAPMTAVGVWSAEEAFVFECHDTMRVDAEWIALMHPGLAEPLADWLDEAARSREAAEIAAALINGNLIGDDGPVDVERLDDTADARRVARVLLGVPE